MRVQRVAVMEKKEEDCVNILVSLGINRTTALILVFLANVGEATSREIERSTDLRQPVVSSGIQALIDKRWILAKKSPQKAIGRPQKIFSLALPFPQILRNIEDEKKHDAECMLQRVKKLRYYLVV